MDEAIILELFKKMLLIRKTEEKIVHLYGEQEMRCPVHLCIGQEAAAAGVCQALSKEDIVFSNHRSHGHYLAKGGNLKRMVAEIYGRSTGCSRGRGGSMHIIDKEANFLGSTSIVGGTIPLAVGAAFHIKKNAENRIAVTFFGDGAVEEGVFHESLNFASLHKLPVLFICENNSYAVNTHISLRQPNRKISDLARAHGLNAIECDGNDAISVYKAASLLKEKIGEAPGFLELFTYRLVQHCGTEFDHLICRPAEEFHTWADRDPLKSLKVKLSAVGTTADKIEKDIQNQVDKAFEFAKTSPFPSSEELYMNVYAENERDKL